jgi:hypothetical protein
MVSMRRSAAPGRSAKSIPAISRVTGGVRSDIAAGVGVGANVGLAEASGDAVCSVSGDDDGPSNGVVAGPHCAMESRTAARRDVLTEEAY